MSSNLMLPGGAGGTMGGDDIADSFHQTVIADKRFVMIQRRPQEPVTTINQAGVEFRFQSITDIYFINDIKIELQVKLVTKEYPHVKPEAGQLVGVVNNTLSSCIKEVKIGVNGINSKYNYLFLVAVKTT